MKSSVMIFFSAMIFFGEGFFPIYGDESASFSLHLSVQGSLSLKTIASLEHSLKEFQKTSCAASVLSASLKETFPVVERVSINYLSHNNKLVTVSASIPVIIINQKYVLTSTEKVVSIDNFMPEQCVSLPVFTLANETQDFLLSDNDYKEFIKRTSLDVYNRFAVTWYNSTVVTLQDKNDSRFMLVANQQTEFLPSLLKKCADIQKSINSRAQSAGTKWCLDVRFKDQIILFSVRGNGHEKGFYEQIAYRN